MSLSKEFVLMKSSTMQYIEELVTRYPVLEKGVCQEFCVNRFNKQHRIAA